MFSKNYSQPTKLNLIEIATEIYPSISVVILFEFFSPQNLNWSLDESTSCYFFNFVSFLYFFPLRIETGGNFRPKHELLLQRKSGGQRLGRHLGHRRDGSGKSVNWFFRYFFWCYVKYSIHSSTTFSDLYSYLLFKMFEWQNQVRI